MDVTSDKKSRKPGIKVWLKRSLVPLSGLLVTVSIIGVVGYYYLQHPEYFEELKTYGYLGAFIISVILNATVIIPVSNMAVIMALGATLPSPIIVGVAGGIGAAIGEMTGYIAGRSGRNLLARSTVYTRVERWVKKWGWVAIFILSVFPILFDVVGIIAGALRMPLWKFLVACWLGRTVSYVFVAYMASLGFKALPWFG